MYLQCKSKLQDVKIQANNLIQIHHCFWSKSLVSYLGKLITNGKSLDNVPATVLKTYKVDGKVPIVIRDFNIGPSSPLAERHV